MRYRRRYRKGRCQDCGRTRNVTQVRWWVNGWAQIYCAECVHQYRHQLLKPGNLSDPYWTQKLAEVSA